MPADKRARTCDLWIRHTVPAPTTSEIRPPKNPLPFSQSSDHAQSDSVVICPSAAVTSPAAATPASSAGVGGDAPEPRPPAVVVPGAWPLPPTLGLVEELRKAL